MLLSLPHGVAVELKKKGLTMKKLYYILPILILIFCIGCGAVGMDGTTSEEEIQAGHWRGWINSLPENPSDFVDYWNEVETPVCDENFNIKEPGEYFFQKGEKKISRQAFLILFDTTGELNIYRNIQVKDGKVFYEGTEIELLKDGKVKTVE